MAFEQSFSVIDWSSRPHHLIRRLMPGTPTYRVDPGMPAEAALHMPLSGERQPHAVLLHIDASQRRSFIGDYDDLCTSLGEFGCEVWNGAVGDIRKRTLQSIFAEIGLPTVAATRDGPPDETLILKTNLNSRGIPEWELSDAQWEASDLGQRRPTPLDGLETYQVMARSDVLDGWWHVRTSRSNAILTTPSAASPASMLLATITSCVPTDPARW